MSEEGLLAMAAAYFDKGLWDKAEMIYRRYLEINPNHPEIMRLLAETYNGKGKQLAALELLKDIATQLPQDPLAHFNLGNQYKLMADYPLAEQSYLQALQLDAEHADTLFNLANIYLELDRSDEAIETFNTLLQTRPDFLPGWVNLGCVYAGRGKITEAVEVFLKATELNPDNPVLRRNLENVRKQQIPPWHFPMLGDKARNDAYQQAIESCVSQGTKVLDVGTGSGLLAMMAVRAGAHEVIACEMSAPIAEAGREVLRANQMEDRVRLLERKSTQLSLQDIGEPADVLISEIVDAGLLGEGVIPSLRHAQQQLLKADAVMIPAKAQVYAALLELPRIADVFPLTSISGFDLSAFGRFGGVSQYRVFHLDSEPHTLLSAPHLAWELDYYRLPPAAGDDQPNQWEIEIEASAAGTIHAIAFWFDLYLTDKLCISTAPDSPVFCWGQAVQHQRKHIKIKPGDNIKIQVEQSDTRLGFELLGM